MKLVFLLEERSMKELLDSILPRIIPEAVPFQTIPHQGKHDLMKSIPIKLRAWNEPDVVFVIVHDQDANDCIALKKELSGICGKTGKQFLIRIPCQELEAWYWGDLPAVSAAFGKDIAPLSKKRKFREPDAIKDPKEELKKLLPGMGQIEAARKIGPHMTMESNTSHSFQVFIRGIQKLVS
ncbi:MAG: DUF4276 family protein [Deltaproteobacteria bacterium]|nr:DUF4276 family protein [Deltaproteobacteria bacterium]